MHQNLGTNHIGIYQNPSNECIGSSITKTKKDTIGEF
jgi:hypothetical protein